MKGSLIIVVRKDLEFIFLETSLLDMKVNGKRIISMDKVFAITKMVKNIWGNFIMANEMVMVNTCILMEIFIEELGKMI